jgi:hypothetical protein
MNTRSNPCLVAVLSELDSVGAQYTITQNRHAKIRWELNGRKGVIICSITSGTMAPNCAIRDIRRQLRGVSL